MKKETRITLLSEFAPILNTKKGLITMYQTYAFNMGRLRGLEPLSAGATIQSVNQLHHNRHAYL